MKILDLDIETAPNLAHVWGLFKQNIGTNQLIETGRVMCLSAKWIGGGGVEFMSEYHDDRIAMLEWAHELLTDADAVLTYNGRKFDLPTLNKEFVMHGMAPPAPYKHIDLLTTVRSQFRFTSNKLDHVCSELGLGNKVRHPGHQLWIDCMNGCPKAWRKMRSYNMHDVRLLERLYFRIQPWIKGHPNHGLYKDRLPRPVCTNCGSHHLHSRGWSYGKTMQYRRYQCQKCGTWVRSRLNDTPAEKKAGLVVEDKG